MLLWKKPAPAPYDFMNLVILINEPKRGAVFKEWDNPIVEVAFQASRVWDHTLRINDDLPVLSVNANTNRSISEWCEHCSARISGASRVAVALDDCVRLVWAALNAACHDGHGGQIAQACIGVDGIDNETMPNLERYLMPELWVDTLHKNGSVLASSRVEHADLALNRGWRRIRLNTLEPDSHYRLIAVISLRPERKKDLLTAGVDFETRSSGMNITKCEWGMNDKRPERGFCFWYRNSGACRREVVSIRGYLKTRLVETFPTLPSNLS